jgi:hypothetical protein
MFRIPVFNKRGIRIVEYGQEIPFELDHEGPLMSFLFLSLFRSVSHQKY